MSSPSCRNSPSLPSVTGTSAASWPGTSEIGGADGQPPAYAGLWVARCRPGYRPAAVVVGGRAASGLARLLGGNDAARRPAPPDAGVGRLDGRRPVVQLEPRVAQGA